MSNLQIGREGGREAASLNVGLTCDQHLSRRPHGKTPLKFSNITYHCNPEHYHRPCHDREHCNRTVPDRFWGGRLGTRRYNPQFRRRPCRPQRRHSRRLEDRSSGCFPNKDLAYVTKL